MHIQTEEERNREAAVELRQLLKHSIDIISIFDEDRRFSDVSKSFETILGYSRSEVVGKKYIDFVHPEDAARVTEKATQMRSSGKDLVNFEIRCRHKQGHFLLMNWSVQWDAEQKKSYGIARDITEKRKIEEQLKETKIRYQSTFDLSPVPKLLIDEETMNIIDVNEAAVNLYGYSREEFLSITAMDIRPQFDKERFLQVWKETKKSNSGFTGYELLHQKKNGELICVNLKANPITVNGRQTLIAVIMDITRTKEYEQQLIETNTKLEEAQKIAKLGYWEANLQNGITFWSDTTYRIWGLNKETFQPDFENFFKTIHPEDLEHFQTYHTKVMSGGKNEEIEYRIVLPDLSVRDIFQRTGLIFDENKVPLKLRGIVLDITEQKQKEKEIKLSNERFELVLKATNEAIWDWDPVTNSIIWGQGFRDIFGYDLHDPENAKSKNIHPDDKERVLKELSDAINNPLIEVFKREYRFLRANGEIAYVKDRGYIVRNKDGKAIRVTGSVLDVTKSRQHALEIQQQNEQLRDIAWKQSHLVRAPLAKIMGLVELVTTYGEKCPEEHKKALSYLRDAAIELDNMIHSVVKETEHLNKEKNE